MLMRTKVHRAIARVAIVAVAAAAGPAGRAAAVAVGEPLSGVAIKRYEPKDAGGPLDEQALKGKITVINFWATWCAACKVELVEMEEQFKPFLATKDFQMAFVALDKEPAKAAAWLAGNLKEPAPFLQRLFVDPMFEAADRLNVDSFPMTLVVGRDGRVAHVQRGFKEGADSTRALTRIATELLKPSAR